MKAHLQTLRGLVAITAVSSWALALPDPRDKHLLLCSSPQGPLREGQGAAGGCATPLTLLDCSFKDEHPNALRQGWDR